MRIFKIHYEANAGVAYIMEEVGPDEARAILREFFPGLDAEREMAEAKRQSDIEELVEAAEEMRSKWGKNLTEPMSRLMAAVEAVKGTKKEVA